MKDDAETVNHKDEAREWIDEAPSELVNAGLNAGTAERAAMCVGLAQANAILALVEAQEAANEQTRIANLIALARMAGDENVHEELQHIAYEALAAFVDYQWTSPDDERPVVPADVATALGIGGGSDSERS